MKQNPARTREFFETLFYSLPDPAILLSINCEVIDVNITFSGTFNLERRDVIGKSIADLFPLSKEMMSNLMQGIKQKTNNKALDDIEVPVSNTRGETIWMSISTRFFPFENETIGISTMRDISKRKTRENELNIKAETYFDLLDNANDMIQSINAEGRFSYVNRRWLEVLGYTYQELPSLTIEDIVHPDEYARCRETFEGVKEGESIENMETVFKSKDGRDIDVQGNISSRFNSGSLVTTRCIFRDITGRKRIRLALQESEEFAFSLLNNAPNPILVINPDMAIRYINTSFERNTCFTSAELVGKKPPYPWWPQDKYVEYAKDIKLSLNQEIRNLESTFQKKSGELFIVERNTIPVKQDNKVKYSISYWADITEYKKADEIIQRRLKFEQTFSIISSMFVGQCDLDTSIEEALAEIGVFCNASRAYMYLFKEPGTAIDNTYQWQAEGAVPKTEKIKTADMDTAPYFMELYKTKGQVIIPGIDALPPQAAREKELMQQAGTQSRLAMSVFDADAKLTGFIGVDDFTAPREWSKEEKSLLQFTADILGNAVERKRTEELYTTLGNSSPIGTYIVQNTRFTFVNPQFQSITGYSADELMGKEALSIVHPEDRQKVRDNAVQMLKSGQPKSIEFRIIRKDGETRWAMETVLSINYRGGKASLGSFIDVTERKRIMEELQEREQRIRSIVANIPGAAYSFQVNQKDRKIRYLSDGIESLTGYPASDFINDSVRSFASVIHPDDVSIVMAEILYCAEKGQPHAIDYRIINKDGSVNWVYDRGQGVYSEHHEALSVYGVILDANTRKQAQLALEESQARFRNLADLLPQSIWEITSKGKFYYYNKELVRSHGYSPKEMTKISFLDMFTAEDRDRMHEDINSTLTGKTIDGIEYTAMQKDGSTFPVMVYATPIVSDSNITGLRGITIDVTELKRMEAELQQKLKELEDANNRLKELDKLKDNFLSTVSHELRTPLTSIKSFAEILLTYDEDRDTQKEFLGIINEESDRLTRLINDFLDLSKIQAGKMNWETSDVPISWAIEKAVHATQSLITQNDQNLTVDIQPELPSIRTDKDRLVQVITNLMSNAIKFTPSGGNIGIKAQLQEQDDTKSILVSVSDNGIGIAPEHHQGIFEKFGQVGDTLKDRPRGTGLGLPICKEIIEHYSGRIWVESELNKGSTFFFTLPVIHEPSVKAMHVKEKPLEAAPLKGKTILVVDDEANIRLLIKHELISRGYLVLEASNGKEAIDLARKHHPDLITLDIIMPDLDGFDVTAVLKQGEGTRNIPILVISVVESRARAYRLGANDYITKPFTIEMLMEQVSNLLRGSQKSILVVDDDETLVKSLEFELRKRGFSTSSAYDGRQALEAVLKCRPELILLDINMPVMNGYEVIKSLKSKSQTSGIPIVVMTGVEIDGGRVKALSVGADDYITKSGGFDSLFDTVERILAEKPAG